MWINRATLQSNLTILASKNTNTTELSHGDSKVIEEGKLVGTIEVDQVNGGGISIKNLIGLKKTRVPNEIGVISVVKSEERGGIKRS